MRVQAHRKSALFCALLFIGMFNQLAVPALSAEGLHRGRIEEDATRRVRRPGADIVEQRGEESQSVPQSNAQSQTGKLTDDSFLLDQDPAQSAREIAASPRYSIQVTQTSLPSELRGKTVIFEPTGNGEWRAVVKAGPTSAEARSLSGQVPSETDWNPWEGEKPLRPSTRYLPDVLPSRTPTYAAPPANYGPYYAPPPPPPTSRWLHIQYCSCGTPIPSSACIAERTSAIYGRSYARRRL